MSLVPGITEIDEENGHVSQLQCKPDRPLRFKK